MKKVYFALFYIEKCSCYDFRHIKLYICICLSYRVTCVITGKQGSLFFVSSLLNYITVNLQRYVSCITNVIIILECCNSYYYMAFQNSLF